MLSTGTIKKERRNPNDPARFIGKVAATEDGETAKIHNYLDTEKIEQEALYDGMYAVTTDLLDDDVKDILKVSEGRWEIEKCFRIMKTDFETKPFFLQDDIRIKAHFLICFLALVIYRYLERDLENAISYEMILDKLRTMKRPGIKYYIPKQHRKSPNLSRQWDSFSDPIVCSLHENFYIGDYNLCFFDGQDVFCELFVSSSISIILLQV